MSCSKFTNIKETSRHARVYRSCVLLSASERRMHPFTAYSELLVELTNHISGDEFSQLKMVFCVDGYIPPARQFPIRNSADLLYYLDSKKIISRHNLSVLSNIFKKIGRADLSSKISDYETKLCQHCDEDQNYKVACESGGPVELAEENEEEIPGSQESMASLSDDEKLLRAGQDKMEMEESYTAVSSTRP